LAQQLHAVAARPDQAMITCRGSDPAGLLPSGEMPAPSLAENAGVGWGRFH